MDYGFVYCIANKHMPGIYKVGKTSRSVLQRAAELSASTSAPSEFYPLFYVETGYMSQVEKEAHEALADCRVRSNREFFECDPRHIKNTLESLCDMGLPVAESGYWLELLEEIENTEELREIRVAQGLDNG